MTLTAPGARRPLLAAFLLAPCLAALAAPPASAQTPADTARADSARAELPSVVPVEGLVVRVPRPATTTGGASAVVVNMDSVTVVPAPTLEHLLREMPLVQIRTNSRGEAQPALRGSEDRQIAVLVDGIPLTLGWDHRTDLSIIPLSAARSVTLLRGLSSVLHGPNVLGGVVEIDVARSAEMQRAPEAVVVSAGVDQTGARSMGVTGGALLDRSAGQWVVRAGAGYREREGYRLPGGLEVASPARRAYLTSDGSRRLNSDFEHVDGFLSARFLGPEGAWASLAASGYTTERGVPAEVHVDDPRLWRYPEQRRLLAAVSGGTGQRGTRWGEGDLEFSLGADLGHTEIDEFSGPDYSEVTAREVDDDRTLTLRLLGDHSLTSRGELRAAFTLADVGHDEVLQPGAEGSYRQRLLSLASEVEWRFDGVRGLDGLRTTRLNLGLAVDGADTPESGDKPPLDRLWDWGGRAGVTAVSAGGSWLFHAGLSRRARFPSLRELYSGALGRFEPNPGLRAEVLIGAEAGFTVRGADAEIQAVAFHNRLGDGIVRTTVQTPEGSKLQRVNRDAIRGMGLELLASGLLGPVSYAADATLQRVRLGGVAPGGDDRLEYEPDLAAGASVAVPVPGRAAASVGVRHVGRQYCVAPGSEDLQSLASSRSLDADVRRGFGLARGRVLSRLDASVAVDNFTDATVYDQCGLPQPGRTFRIQVRVW